MTRDHEILNEISGYLHRTSSMMFTLAQAYIVPRWNDSISTACVGWGDDSKEWIVFDFNRKFWESLTHSEKCFLFTHEVLHILLFHGISGKEFFDKLPEDQKSYEILNKVQDICINEMILEQYITDVPLAAMPQISNGCFIHTVFPDNIDEIKRDKSFEYYYLKYLELHGNSSNDNGIVFDIQLDLSGLSNEEISKIADKVGNILGIEGSVSQSGEDEEKEGAGKDIEALAKTIAQVLKEELTQLNHGYALGQTVSNSVVDAATDYSKYNLEDYLNLISKTSMQKSPKPQIKNTWYGLNRRNSNIGKDIHIPVKNTISKSKKHRVIFYCDVSGSCSSITEKFLSMIDKIDESKYEKIIHVFASRVQKCTKSAIGFEYSYAGGGTDIREVLKHYDSNFFKEHSKVDCVIVLTDGEYVDISNESNNLFSKWHFFFVNAREKHTHNLPEKSKRYVISEY